MAVIDAGTPGVLFRLRLWVCCLRPYKLAGPLPAAPTRRCFMLLAPPPPRINHFTWPASEVSSESLPAAQSVRSLRKMPGMTEAVYCISAASLQRTASFPCIVCVFRHRLLLFAFYRLLWLAAFSSLSEARGMLFTAVICNQQTRSPLNPLVSSMDVAGEMELWLMHGLFCLWERGRVCDLLQ